MTAKVVLKFLIPVAFALYIGGMVAVGKAFWWGRRGDPGFVWPNSRIVRRDEEPGLYWGSIAFHLVLAALASYFAWHAK